MSYLCVTSVFFFLFFFLSYSNHSLYVLADASDVLVCYVSDWIAVIIWSGPRRLGGKEKWWGWSVLRREEAKFTSSYISVHCTTPKNAAVRWAKTLWIKGGKKKKHLLERWVEETNVLFGAERRGNCSRVRNHKTTQGSASLGQMSAKTYNDF